MICHMCSSTLAQPWPLPVKQIRNLKETQMEQMKTTKNIGNIKIETNKCKKLRHNKKHKYEKKTTMGKMKTI